MLIKFHHPGNEISVSVVNRQEFYPGIVGDSVGARSRLDYPADQTQRLQPGRPGNFQNQAYSPLQFPFGGQQKSPDAGILRLTGLEILDHSQHMVINRYADFFARELPAFPV